jgi:hypothetical protein
MDFWFFSALSAFSAVKSSSEESVPCCLAAKC